jgi:hypothetical protein
MMQPQIFRQFGKWTVFVLMFISLGCLAMLVYAADNDDKEMTIITACVLVALQVCLTLFYQLTITVTEERVSFRMGIGLIGQSYNIKEIQSCQAIKSSLLYGFGIHWFPKGIIYNVSGVSVIELRFKNRRSVVRIGTDRPEEVAQLINSLITA